MASPRRGLGSEHPWWIPFVPHSFKTVVGRPPAWDRPDNGVVTIGERTPGGPPAVGAAFVGRRSALRNLTAALEGAEAGQGALLLISGEPGIGKTRLCVEFEHHARSRGAQVAWGSCWEGEGAPAYRPWIQILRRLVDAGIDQAPAFDALSADVAALIAGNAPPAAGDPEQVRFRLFDAISRTLAQAAGARPLVIVLDDLHWADTASLLILRVLAGELSGRRLIIVGTYRDVEVTPNAPLGQALAHFGSGVRNVPLRGLDREEIRAMIALSSGSEPDPRVVDALLRRTGGNPFFIEELLRLAQAEPGLDALRDDGISVPAGVRQVVDRRLEGLSDQARGALEAAAVLGQDFDLDVTAETAGLPRSVVASAFEGAEAGRLISGTDDPARFAFSHALVRDVLYRGIGIERLGALHLRAAGSLDRRHATDPTRLAEIAAHLALAAPAGDPAKAATYAFDAGRHAMSLLAWEEAATHFERTLRALDRTPHAERIVARCDVLLALGEASVRAGHTDRARESFLAAAEVARASADGTRFARAALGLGTASPVWGVDLLLTELLETALGFLDGEPALAAQVSARLAQARYFSAPDAERDELSGRAVEMARSCGDDDALAATLVTRRVLWGPGDLAGRAAVADELLALARRTGNADLDVQARSWRVIDLVEGRDLAAADRERLAHAALARRSRQPLHGRDEAIWRAMRALLDGRFADAERDADEALLIGERTGDPGARPMHVVQRAMIRAEEGDPARVDDAIPLVREIANEHPEIPAWRALLAFCEARAGQADQARLDLEQVGAAGFASVRRDATYLVALTHAADAAAIIGHRDVAAALLPLLEGFADRAVVIDRGLACKGITTRLLGLLHGVLDEKARAIELLERSLVGHERMGASAFAARNRAELAAALLRRGDAGDSDRAATLLDEAERSARTLRMPDLATQVGSIRRGDATREPSGDSVFRREGEWWTLAFAGRTVRLRDAKGLGDIARLLAKPEREVHVLDLVGPTDPAASRSGPAAEILDAEARRAYEARIVDLEEEIAEAQVRHDTERVARAREESQFLVSELSGALGLGGRPRRVTDETERARKAVAWRIRDCVKRIERDHPDLARHLRAALRTGVYCTYRPERPVAWQLGKGTGAA